MRALVTLLAVAACSNAASPAIDAPPGGQRDAPQHADTGRSADAPADLRILVVNEVDADADWFEIVNATQSPVELADFVFVDEHDNFTKAVPFAQQQLAPGGYVAQDCDGTVVPFKLASDEEIWVYRASDHALSDGVDWTDGDSPKDGSYARDPDVFGTFATTLKPTKGTANEF